MQIKEQHVIDKYYQALVDRDSAFVGIFFVGVKTTSIFCIATCRARKPKIENVVFYTTVKEALDQGFRPCKICKPTENALTMPDQVTKAIQLIKANPKEKIKDYQLRAEQISPEFVRRWFNKNYGLTFHAYQRMYRINHAFMELKEGKKTTDTAFQSGYDSLSGFGYTFKKIIGHSPKHSTKINRMLISRLTTPIGPMFVCATDQGLCLLEFVDRRMLETEFKDLQRLLKMPILFGENEHTLQAKKELKEYFEGKRKKFDLVLDTPGTDFQNTVWSTLRTIPFGTTTTYQALAQQMKKPKAIRAVGTANGYNRLAIIIPCHRVIGKDGALRGYGGGLERKQWLLDFEKNQT